jgi:hypothetical protein
MSITVYLLWLVFVLIENWFWKSLEQAALVRDGFGEIKGSRC